MITPEEDFETWLLVASSTIDSVSSFEPFVPQIQDLLNQIIENKEFKDPIKGKESAFIKELYWKFIPKFKKLGTLTENELLIIINCLKMIMSFCFKTIEKDLPDYLRLFSILIPDESWTLISKNSEANIELELIEYIKSEDAINKFINAIDEKHDSYSFINQLTHYLILLNKYVPEINLNDISKKFTQHLATIAKDKIRQIVPVEIHNILDKLVKSIIDEEAVFGWLNLFDIFMKCDIFNLQLYGYQAIKFMLDQKDLQEIVYKWFLDPKHLEFLRKQTIHQEIMQYVAYIISALVRNNLIPFDIIQNLWNFNSQIHTTALDKFYQMFYVIAKVIPMDFLFDYCTMCVNPHEKNQIWFQFLVSLAHAIGDRNDALEPYQVLRNEFWQLSFDGGDLQEMARSSLKSTLGFHLTPEQLKQITTQVLETMPTYEAFEILGSVVNAHQMPDEESIAEFLGRAIDALATSDDAKTPIFNFITNICVENSMNISDEDCEKIFSLPHDKELYKFLQEVVDNDLISPQAIKKFLSCVELSEVDQNFIDLLKIFMQKSVSESGITRLPFDGEKILWKLSTANIEQRSESMDLLVRAYLGQDGNPQIDNRIINAFIDRWLTYFRQSENKNYVLDILRYFLIDAEYLVDYEEFDIIPHALEVAPKVNVEIVSSGFLSTQKHVVPENMTIAVLTRRVARYAKKPVGSFTLKIANKELTSISQVKEYIQNGEVKISAYSSTSQKVIDRTYTELPSEIIASSEIPSMLIQLLRENVNEAKLVLDYLPTVPYTLAIIEAIQKLDYFDYKPFLPIEFPRFFMYNFESMISLVSPRVLTRTGGIDYLIDCIPEMEFYVVSSIINFFDTKLSHSEKRFSAQKIFDSCFKRLYNNFDKQEFITISNFLIKIEKLKDVDIVLPGFFQDAAKIFFLCENKEIIKAAGDLLSELTINQDILIPLVFQCHNEFAGLILKTISSHLVEFSQELFDFIMKSLEEENCKYINDALSCMLKLVKIGIDSQNSEILADKLIEKYLQTDGTCDKNSFMNACRILGRLNTANLQDKIRELHGNMHPISKWSINGDCPRKSSLGSGLINLGATCFLNSSLQQFFYILPLRTAILNYEGDDIFCQSLKTLYAHMLISRHFAQTPTDLVSKWVGWDGEPMNPMMQQDACEFIQNLLDKLEKALGVDFIHSLFQGKTIHHTDGLTADFHTSSEEPFYSFSMPVKGVTNVEQSLEQLSAPDFFTGDNQYKSEEFGKIDVKRYSSIGNCPPFLIIQLARFEYNYAMYTRTKIDTPFDFPIDLRFGDYDYKLSGVIVHIGTADFGHYVSYVRDRQTNNWRLCNDETVTPASEKSVKEAGFGSSNKSAYLLFYDRVDYEYDKSQGCEVNSELKEAIEQENETLDEINILFSTPYFRLMRLLKDESSLFYFCNILPYSIFQEKAKKLVDALCESVQQNEKMPEYLVQLIEQKVFLRALLHSPDLSIREGSLRLIANVADKLTEEAHKALFSDMNSFCDYYANIQSLFTALFICVQTEKGMKVALEDEWQNTLHAILSTRINDFITEKKLKKEMFWSHLNVSSMLELISKLPIDDTFKLLLQSDDFIKLVFLSPTAVISLATVLKASQYTNEQIEQFLDKHSVSLTFNKTIELLIFICDSVMFDLIDKYTFIVGERCASLMDKLACYAYLVKIKDCKGFFVENISKWFGEIINEDSNIRSATAHIVSFIIPTEFFVSLGFFPQTEQDSEEMEFHAEKKNEEMEEYANKILDYLVNTIDDLLKECEPKYKANRTIISLLFNIAAGLFEITNRKEAVNIVEKLVEFVRPIAVDFDPTAQQSLMFLAKQNVFVKVADDFIKQPQTNNFLLANIFINSIVPHLAVEGVNEATAKIIFEYYGLPLNNQRIPNNSGILSLLSLAGKFQPQVAKEFITGKEINTNNFQYILTILKSAQLSLPILDKLSDFLTQTRPSNYNTIVEDAFAVHGENAIESKWLESLVDDPLLTGHARDKVLKALGLKEAKKGVLQWFFEESYGELPSPQTLDDLCHAALDAMNSGLHADKLVGLAQALSARLELTDMEFLGKLKEFVMKQDENSALKTALEKL